MDTVRRSESPSEIARHNLYSVESGPSENSRQSSFHDAQQCDWRTVRARATLTIERALALIAKGEGQRIELQESTGESREATRSLVAMVNANAGGGHVFFAVRNDGTIRGVSLGSNTKTMEQAVQTITGSTDPVISLQKCGLIIRTYSTYS